MKRSTVRSVSVVIAAVLATTLIAPYGFADAYDAAMARAVAAKEKAVDSNDPAAWQEALKLFEEADAIKATKDSKYELANAAARLKEDDVAVEAYEAAIALGLAGKAKEKAQAFIKANASKMGRIAVKGPAGASVQLGIRSRGALPRTTPFVVFAGSVKVRITHEGKTVEKTVEASAGATVDVDADALFAAAPVPSATTSPTSTPSATTSASAPPPLPKEVPIGDRGAGARALGWSLIVGGGVTILLGGGTVIAAGSGIAKRRESLDAHCINVVNDTCPAPRPLLKSEAQSDVDAIATWKAVRTIGWVALGTGATIAIVGMVRLFTAPSAPKETAATWTPSLAFGPNGSVYLGLSGAL